MYTGLGGVMTDQTGIQTQTPRVSGALLPKLYSAQYSHMQTLNLVIAGKYTWTVRIRQY